MDSKTPPTGAVPAMREAIAAIVRHNRRLRDAIAEGFPCIPPLSQLLKCEFNGAHALIENVATCIKALPRGDPAVQVPHMILTGSSENLLSVLQDISGRLPPDVPFALRQALRHAIDGALETEQRIHNFVIGASGASPGIGKDDYCLRIDKFVRDLKQSFAVLNTAISDIEETIDSLPPKPAKPPRQTKRKSKAHAPRKAKMKTKGREKVPVTKADLRTAVKTILRGEDVNLSKPGPRLTPAKRQQIDAAKAYRKSHNGCTLHNACLRSFAAIPGGYASGKSLYRVMKRMNN